MSQMSLFSSEEPHVSPSVSQDLEKDWTIRVVTSRSPILPLLTDIGPSGWFGRMCPASCQAAEDGTLVPSSGAWGNSGMGGPTESLTLNTSEHAASPTLSRSGGVVCSLSDILETGDVPQRFYLTPKACAGILRRAEKRGKDLPEMLHKALLSVVETAEEPLS